MSQGDNEESGVEKVVPLADGQEEQADSDSESVETAPEAKEVKKRKQRVVARDRADSLRLIEAALFASSEPLTASELAPYVVAGESLDKLIATLREGYEGKGVQLERVARGWAFRTAPDLGERLKIVRERKRRISRAAAETLAVIAYNQPITRGQIEEIRGVALSGGTLDILFEAGWVAPKGRADQPGHPLLWGTTPAFLDQFSLANLSDLPAERELRASGLLDGRAALAVVSEQAAESGEENAGEEETQAGDEAEDALPAPDFVGDEPLAESFEESFDAPREISGNDEGTLDDALDDPLAGES